jgi:hypothetical protein
VQHSFAWPELTQLRAQILSVVSMPTLIWIKVHWPGIKGSPARPLRPQTRIDLDRSIIASIGMAASGAKRSFQDVRCMFAFGGKADIRRDL